ncbi:putative disease resistance protein RGA3 [Musa acuminata AAA Group]|uniref:putative disease resistance protein RGA3 n=1 Tax=Musa acuminata AAA Group TaxID=214697 RepID=UPI0031E33602
MVGWMKELRDVAYDAEDLLDELEYRRLRQQLDGESSSPVSASLSPTWRLLGMWPPEPVASFLRVSLASKAAAAPPTRSTGPKQSTKKGATSSLISTKVFGRGDEVRNLIDLLLLLRSNDEPVSVLPVVGIGGVGKTTLAQLVYNDPKIVQHFELRMWICVSDSFDDTELAREILECASSGDNLQQRSVTNFNRLQTAIKEQFTLGHEEPGKFAAIDQLISDIAEIGRLTCLERLHVSKVRTEAGYPIRELRDLNELRGSLYVWNLENVESKNKASEAMLNGKEHLSVLQLQWQSGERNQVVDDDDGEVLEGLRPHPNLKRLEIMGSRGATYLSWLKTQWLTDLNIIYLSGCRRWESLPPLAQLPSLKVLWIQGMQATKSIGWELFTSTSNQPSFL